MTCSRCGKEIDVSEATKYTEVPEFPGDEPRFGDDYTYYLCPICESREGASVVN